MPASTTPSTPAIRPRVSGPVTVEDNALLDEICARSGHTKPELVSIAVQEWLEAFKGLA